MNFQRSLRRTRYSFDGVATDIVENLTGTVQWPRLPFVAERREVWGGYAPQLSPSEEA